VEWQTGQAEELAPSYTACSSVNPL